MEMAGERGASSFTLEVRVSNASAIHLYEKLGFQSVGIRKNFYEKPTEDAMIMWKR
jgi:ribosomal-protein-alanine N-acetyltransferase